MNSKTIVIGVDFKSNTLLLCKKAIKYANTMKCSVTLVHIYEDIYSLPTNGAEIINYLAENNIPNQLDRLEVYLKLYEIDVNPSIIRRGNPTELLPKIARKLNAEAIFVGRGQNFVFQELMETTTEKVARTANQKVFILDDKRFSQPTTIVCGFDLSITSYETLRSAWELASMFDANLKVVYVHKSNLSDKDIMWHLKDAVHTFISDLQKPRTVHKQTIEPDIIIRRGNPANEISKYANQLRADLLVLGQSDQANIKKLILGTNMRRMIKKAKCSVLITPNTTGNYELLSDFDEIELQSKIS